MRKTDRRKDKQIIHLAHKLTNRREIQTDRQLKEVERETEGTNIQTERV